MELGLQAIRALKYDGFYAVCFATASPLRGGDIYRCIIVEVHMNNTVHMYTAFVRVF